MSDDIGAGKETPAPSVLPRIWKSGDTWIYISSDGKRSEHRTLKAAQSSKLNYEAYLELKRTKPN